MKKLLWIGDAGCPSGFAVATHNTLAHLRPHYDITVLGMNYRGDPYWSPTEDPYTAKLEYPYPIYAAAPGGDSFGVGRLIWMCDYVKPDVIVLQNDGWNIPMYMAKLRRQLPNGEYAFPDIAAIPVVAAIAVDGKNFQGAWLDGIQSAIFWTKFAADEARQGGYSGYADVIPLGVNTDVYHPMDRYEARLRRKVPSALDDAFIVGAINRNQSRKRWDLTIKYFAAWIKNYKVNDAWLFVQSAPTVGDTCDIVQLARYYGVEERLAYVEPEMWYGYSEEDMCATYNCFDLFISTTQGEGWGLPAIEAMACGVPCILPDWSAYGEWARRGAWMVKCSTTAMNAPNVIGGVADEAHFVAAMHKLYRDRAAREQNAQAALECARQPQFRWENIGRQWLQVIDAVTKTERVMVEA